MERFDDFGGGGGGDGSLARSLDFVVHTTMPESDCIWIHSETGERISAKIKATSMLAQGLLKSESAKSCYALIDNGENLQLQGNGLFRIEYLGGEYYFGFDRYGGMITGLYEATTSTKLFSMKSNIVVAFAQSQNVVTPMSTYEMEDTIFNITSGVPGKYYLYEPEGICREILWNIPTIINGSEY